MGWILAVDVGNTVTRLAATGQEGLAPVARLPTAAEDFPLLLATIADRMAVRFGRAPEAIGTSCVVPGRQADLAGLGPHLGAPLVAVSPRHCAGLVLAYRDPASLGADRIANAYAVREGWGAPAIAVDLGTALTLDVVNADGRFVGGAIFPGLAAARQALGASAARLGPGPGWRPERAIGDSTDLAIAAGMGYGYPGLIDGLLARVRGELGGQAPAVLTGGGVAHLGALPEGVQRVDPHLTLRGVAAIAAAECG